jgi:hypothetical protein
MVKDSLAYCVERNCGKLKMLPVVSNSSGADVLLLSGYVSEG